MRLYTRDEIIELDGLLKEMCIRDRIKIAVYGKGGIGKSTTVSNVAAALAEQGLKAVSYTHLRRSFTERRDGLL